MTGLGALGQLEHQVDGPALGLAKDVGVEVLGPGEDVEADEVQPCRCQIGKQVRYLLLIDSELLGPPPMRIPEPLTAKLG